MSSYETISVTTDGSVATVALSRPEARNALNETLRAELADALEELDARPDLHAIVLTGDERAFAAGADLTEMVDADPLEMHRRDGLGWWARLQAVSTPLIAAVRGYALGGGNELALVCDIVIAGEGATFGQPEINVGILPGGGGTQRLTHAIGKAKAMDWILTGRLVSADEAERAGMVSRVVPDERVLEAALDVAGVIAAKSALAVELAKDSVLAAHRVALTAGLPVERRNFCLLFATDEQHDLMDGFLNRRR
jgi:enoyl-CoA hydratase